MYNQQYDVLYRDSRVTYRIDSFYYVDLLVLEIYCSGRAGGTPKAATKTFTAVIKKIPMTVKLFILSARQICSIFFTLYRLFKISPTPTATWETRL